MNIEHSPLTGKRGISNDEVDYLLLTKTHLSPPIFLMNRRFISQISSPNFPYIYTMNLYQKNSSIPI
ncbi:MAG: hypothetical protein COW85_06655 [Ignavibacteria bacterium CG22_combo_CG10-13_8_21_14_all_37_15]|nr:MAG: hypothetical protein COW85_06655 [Ignavibacteria bacterium CG22_combo_CG10-13_8_21_14_all_37_15]PIX93975.1 MAG: hypothetical protein COZ25_07970 [Ignavibacteria bacterium CG_4_10_14_3_um_filter_37_18]